MPEPFGYINFIYLYFSFFSTFCSSFSSSEILVSYVVTAMTDALLLLNYEVRKITLILLMTDILLLFCSIEKNFWYL